MSLSEFCLDNPSIVDMEEVMEGGTSFGVDGRVAGE
jgi:hypothetical protein